MSNVFEKCVEVEGTSMLRVVFFQLIFTIKKKTFAGFFLSFERYFWCSSVEILGLKLFLVLKCAQITWY